ncbi:hypothetical protein ACVWWP_007172 [Bradyrhizobium sp. LM3.6]
MAYTEDHIALAAEYALGTLDADERAQVETMMAVDKAFAEIVQAWAYRIGVLNQMVGSIEPRPIVWENIRSELARTDFAQEPPALQDVAPPLPPPVPEFSSLDTVPPEAAVAGYATTGAAASRSGAGRNGALRARCDSRRRADIHAAGPCARPAGRACAAGAGRRQQQCDPARGPCEALAHHRIRRRCTRGRAARDAVASDIPARGAAGRLASARAHPDGRGEDTGVASAFVAIRRAVAGPGRRSRLHPHHRRCVQEFYRAQGRRDAGARQEFRASG